MSKKTLQFQIDKYNHNNIHSQKDGLIWFVRHGESEAHIGKAATRIEEIRLTHMGRCQAEKIISDFPCPPAQVISSPYMRAWETAAPTLQRFPDTPHAVWPVQEFTYLGSLSGIYSTKSERYLLVDEYWRRCDPTYQDGNGETFAQFIQRVRMALRQIKQLNGFALIFTHEQFIRAAQGLLEGWLNETPEAMARFREILITQPLDYCATLRLSTKGNPPRLYLYNKQACLPCELDANHSAKMIE